VTPAPGAEGDQVGERCWAKKHRPLQADRSHGESLRVGDKVAFTGCDWAVRERLE
jgi:hypothetical protein